MTYQGYPLPIYNADTAVRNFNDHDDRWCHGDASISCESASCEQCLLCMNYGDGTTKTRIFAMWAFQNGFDITRSDVNIYDITHDIHQNPRCKVCGEITELNTDGVCDHCLSQYHRCTYCGMYVDEDYVISAPDEPDRCIACADRITPICGVCGRRSVPCQRDSRGTPVCASCADSIAVCSVCGRFERSEHATHYNDRIYCRACASEEMKTIHNYSFHPLPLFYKCDNDDECFMGIELEVGDASEATSCAASKLLAQTYHEILYLKRDSSIPDYGFEIVTHPCTFKYHTDEFPWSKILYGLHTSGFKSHNATQPCGLHIHVSRNYLTDCRWMIVDWFVTRYRDKWIAIARRDESHYAHIKYKDSCLSFKEQYGKSYDRYTAVNFCNRNTVEFRLYRGTLLYSTFMATIAITHGLVSWARQVRVHDILSSSAWDSFVNYLKRDPKYQSAITYMSRRGVIQSQNN